MHARQCKKVELQVAREDWQAGQQQCKGYAKISSSNSSITRDPKRATMEHLQMICELM